MSLDVAPEKSAVQTPPVIVDCDIHESLKSIKDLEPYIGDEWLPFIINGNGLSKPLYHIRSGTLRLDAKNPDGTSGGMYLEQIQRQHLDAHGINYGILLAEFGLGIALVPQRQFAHALAGAYNRWLLDTFIGKDPRLKGSLVVAPQVPEQAAELIREFGGHPDIVQVALSAPPSDLPWGNERYDPIWQACVDLDLRVAFHLALERGLTGAPLGGWPQTYMQIRAAYPLQFQAQLMDLVCNGVFEKFPELKIVMVEGGFGWVPNVMWRLDSAWRSLRAEVPWLRRRPSDYIRDHVRFTTQPFDEPDDPRDIDRVIDMMGSEDMILFSTDYPHWDFDAPDQAFPRTIGEERKRRILGQNALAFYGLPQPGQP